MPVVSTLCVVENCSIPRRHVDGCPGDVCAGCLPALAATGLRVCGHHERRTRDGLRELADLWEALAERSRTKGIASRGSAGTDPAQPISDDRRQARSAIVGVLSEWSRTLADTGINPPDERNIVSGTRRAVLDAQDAAEACRVAHHAAQAAVDEHGRPDEHTRALAPGHLNEAARHSHRAAALRNRRESGADVVEAFADHLDRHAGRLLAGEHADQLVHDVAALVAHRGLVSSGRAAPTVRCSCGERVPMDVDLGDDTQVFTCRGCGSWGVLSWWQEQEGADPDPLPLSALPAWLGHWHNIAVTLDQLRHWSKPRPVPRAHATDCADLECAGCAVLPAVIQPIEAVRKGQTARYDPVAVAAVAADLLQGGRHGFAPRELTA